MPYFQRKDLGASRSRPEGSAGASHRAAWGPFRTFPQFFPLACGESCLTEPSAFSILYVLSGVFHPSSKSSRFRGMAGWKGILRSRNKLDGMGQKSGRNGAPAPKSRVSLSDSEPRADLRLLECVRSFLLVSPDSQYTFQHLCVLSRFAVRVKRELGNLSVRAGKSLRSFVSSCKSEGVSIELMT